MPSKYIHFVNYAIKISLCGNKARGFHKHDKDLTTPIFEGADAVKDVKQWITDLAPPRFSWDDRTCCTINLNPHLTRALDSDSGEFYFTIENNIIKQCAIPTSQSIRAVHKTSEGDYISTAVTAITREIAEANGIIPHARYVLEPTDEGLQIIFDSVISHAENRVRFEYPAFSTS